VQEITQMRAKISAAMVIAVTFVGMGGAAWAAHDRYALSIPDGLSFAEFRGYQQWQNVAVSATASSVKSIQANPVMIRAYKAGAPGNGQLFPEGSKIAKIEWLKQKNPLSPYFVEIPQSLKSISFIVKDTKRFPATHGWAYAKFDYDPASDTFKPDSLSVKGHDCGYACHTAVAANDYIFTAYPKR
jgi:hypothetical protein